MGHRYFTGRWAAVGLQWQSTAGIHNRGGLFNHHSLHCVWAVVCLCVSSVLSLWAGRVRASRRPSQWHYNSQQPPVRALNFSKRGFPHRVKLRQQRTHFREAHREHILVGFCLARSPPPPILNPMGANGYGPKSHRRYAEGSPLRELNSQLWGCHSAQYGNYHNIHSVSACERVCVCVCERERDG